MQTVTQARRAVFVPGLTDHVALTYDGLNRLKSITGPVAESFTLDGASNITARTRPNQTELYDNANWSPPMARARPKSDRV